jgi:integrase
MSALGHPNVVNTLREWKLVCPKGDLDLVFPNKKGKLWDHVHIVENFLQPTLVRAGIVDANGKAKYPGLHALRHFCASYCINRRQDGGLELPIKTVQERMGHASITITSDVYGHLFPTTARRWQKRRECSLRSARRDTDATCGQIIQRFQRWTLDS